jgi:hypothetical protein
MVVILVQLTFLSIDLRIWTAMPLIKTYQLIPEAELQIIRTPRMATSMKTSYRLIVSSSNRKPLLGARTIRNTACNYLQK